MITFRWARALVAFAVLTLLCLAPAVARAGGTLDQTSPGGGTSFNVGTASLVWQQQIKAGIGGQLAGITITLDGPVGAGVTLGVRKGAAPSTQPLVFQQVVTFPGPAMTQQQVFVDMTASNILLAAGDVFVMELSGSASLDANGSYVMPPGMPNYSQPLFLNGAAYAGGGFRFAFMTYVYTCTPGAACNDNNPCTVNDVCSATYMCAGTPVVCTASDACHVAGTCDPTSGKCSNPSQPDGTACDDGNACTHTDTCVGGTCTGGSPVTCTAMDQCHTAGACNPASGLCTNPSKADGTSCNDANPCTQTDTCVAGVCTGMSPVVCPPPDACHVAGTCDTTTGMCSNPAKTDGAACDDGNACTQTDTCVAGVCTGASPVTCTAMDQCHTAGMCDPTTGVCSNPAKANGASCDDGNKCTQTDTCQQGACVGGNPVTCAALDACHLAGTCAASTGSCSNPLAADGTACAGGTCESGLCKPSTGAGGSSTGGSSTGGSSTGGSGAGGSGASNGVNKAGGCGCRVGEAPAGAVPSAALLLLLAVRRRSRQRAA